MTPLVSQQVKAATVELPQVFLYMYDITNGFARRWTRFKATSAICKRACHTGLACARIAGHLAHGGRGVLAKQFPQCW